MANVLWQKNDLEKALGVKIGVEKIDATGVSIDTRTLKKGDIFVALKGDPGKRFHTSSRTTGDGHNFIAKAKENGAVCAIVERVDEEVEIPQIAVENTIDALWSLGKFSRDRAVKNGAKLVAVTGSCGKTSTKEFISAGLSECGLTHCSIGSCNNFLGVPLSLSRMPKGVDFGVFEVGMNHEGEIAPLSKLITPHVSCITNVRPVHLQYFENIDKIRLEKLSIAQGLVKPEGCLVVPSDLDMSGQWCENWWGETITFGDNGDVAAVNVSPSNSWEIDAVSRGQDVRFSLNPGGPHRISNALCAVAVAEALMVDIYKFINGLEMVGVASGRGVATEVNGITVIDDSFNANPASVAVALQSLKASPCNGRRIAVLGDMLELGEDAPKFHQNLAEECKGLDGVLAVGELAENLYKALPDSLRIGYEPSPKDLSPHLVSTLLQSGDIVLVKGSKKIFWNNDFANRLVECIK